MVSVILHSKLRGVGLLTENVFLKTRSYSQDLIGKTGHILC